MPRAKNAVAARARRKKVLKQTKEKMFGRFPKTHMKKVLHMRSVTDVKRNQNLEHCGFRELMQLSVWKACLILNLWV